jgi:hypothetical protein
VQCSTSGCLLFKKKQVPTFRSFRQTGSTGKKAGEEPSHVAAASKKNRRKAGNAGARNVADGRVAGGSSSSKSRRTAGVEDADDDVDGSATGSNVDSSDAL